MSHAKPVEIAHRVWWVGTRLPDDRFQCHAYLIENGSDSVLVDPGSPLTIDATLDLVTQVVPLEHIRSLVCHHSDPDIAAALPRLSDVLPRPDVQVVTEWRAAALLRHYGHRFEYYLVEANDWVLQLGADRQLQFQLTPYLHFPGALVSFDSATATLFSSDLFGGFVPDASVLISDDVDYIIEQARPFHQHYMPSNNLLRAGLNRIQQRWPGIERIAPQHGHLIPRHAVARVFEELKNVECGVFTLADADMDLRRLLRIAETRTQITEALLTVAHPGALVRALTDVLAATHHARDCALFVELPDMGWSTWRPGHSRPTVRTPPANSARIELPGSPPALLSIRMVDDAQPDPDLIAMLRDLADAMRGAVDHYLEEYPLAQRVTDLREAALTDPLTGLRNRHSLDEQRPSGTYSVIVVDIDHFKRVNDEYGHATGDTVLAGVADVLVGGIRAEDSAYRMGGEEFAVLLPGSDTDRALRVAERLRLTVRDLDLGGLAPGGHVTISLGVCSVEGADEAAFGRALKAADAALYRSKQGGRDRVTLAV